MLNKIGYINGIKFDELQAHLFSIEDRSKYYYYPKTQECGYKAVICRIFTARTEMRKRVACSRCIG